MWTEVIIACDFFFRNVQNTTKYSSNGNNVTPERLDFFFNIYVHVFFSLVIYQIINSPSKQTKKSDLQGYLSTILNDQWLQLV
jgi:hypothetical protein